MTVAVGVVGTGIVGADPVRPLPRRRAGIAFAAGSMTARPGKVYIEAQRG